MIQRLFSSEQARHTFAAPLPLGPAVGAGHNAVAVPTGRRDERKLTEVNTKCWVRETSSSTKSSVPNAENSLTRAFRALPHPRVPRDLSQRERNASRSH
jgi:hypothetical protein